MINKVYLITGNEGKLSAARSAFSTYGIEVVGIDTDVPEIQADSSVEIARYCVLQYQPRDAPLIREDHSLFIDALNGFPGPYVKYVESVLDASDLLTLLEGKKRSARWVLGAAVLWPDGFVSEYESVVECEIADTIRGSNRNFDRIFCSPGTNTSYSEIPLSDSTWAGNFKQIAFDMKK